MPRVVRTEIDGVPTLWSTAPGPLTAGLMFRVGRAHERPVDGGITHLVEHLAMSPLGQPRYDHNAFVEGERTIFYATGSPQEVAGFLDSVTRSLSSLPLERLEKEREVLRREARGREGSVIEAHRHLRFGFQGHGLVGEPEFGLSSLQAERIDGWSKFAFTRQNAALWLTGEPPADLRLHLGDGRRLPAPELTSVPDVTLPAHVKGVPGFGVGFLLPRRRGAGTFMSILHRRLRQHLRIDLGIAYEVLASYEPLDAEWAAALIGTDCQPEEVDDVAGTFFAELESLRQGAVTETELSDEVLDMERAIDDPTAVSGLLDMMARDELVGMDARSPEDRYQEQVETSSEDVADRAADALSTAMLLSDSDVHPEVFTPYPLSSQAPVAGRQVKPRLSAFGLGRRQRLWIGPEGVTLVASDGHMTTIRYADCVMLERPEGDDDDIVLWDRDGDRIYIPSIFWRGGDQILAEILAAIPPDLVITDRISIDLMD